MIEELDPSFRRGEYWLLESVVEYKISLSLLAKGDRRIGEFLNKTSPLVSRGSLVSCLESLFSRRLIYAVRTTQTAEVVGPEQLFLSREQIEACFEEPGDAEWNTCCLYGLTREGGAAWEAFAKPDWSLYIDDHYVGPFSNAPPEAWQNHFVMTAKLKRLERYITAMRTEITIDDASMAREVVEPWSATYWKDVPRGYKAQFRSKWEPDKSSSLNHVYRVMQGNWGMYGPRF